MQSLLSACLGGPSHHLLPFAACADNLRHSIPSRPNLLFLASHHVMRAALQIDFDEAVSSFKFADSWQSNKVFRCAAATMHYIVLSVAPERQLLMFSCCTVQIQACYPVADESPQTR